MEKEFEALELVDKMANYILLDEEYGFIDDEEKQAIIKDRETIAQALLKAQENEKKFDDKLIFKNGCKMSGFDYKGKQIVAMPVEEYDKFMEQDEVLEIIKEKDVDMYAIGNCEEVEFYNEKFTIYEYQKLTEEEFNKVKRWSEK